MAVVRVRRLALQNGPATTSVRIRRVAVVGTASSAPAVRIRRLALNGTAPAAVSVRVRRLEVLGTEAIVLLPLGNSTVEPGSRVILKAFIDVGGPATSYDWRVISSDIPIELVINDSEASFLAPSSMPPNSVHTVIGVIARNAGSASVEVTSDTTTLPQIRWTRIPDGPWVGATRPALLGPG